LEVVMKSASGKLDVGDVRLWWSRAGDDLAARVLPVRPEHAAALHDLPPIYKDPIDRMLMAQAVAEDLTLVTTDRTFLLYASDRLRILL
jgi:PIN domain nuclease of toxin-antitoxin system